MRSTNAFFLTSVPKIDMKKLSGFAAALLGLVAVALPTRAQIIISFQYQTNGASPVANGVPDTAGADSAAGWNTSHALPYVSNGTSETSSGLLTSTGATTSVSETTLSAGGYDGSTGSSFAAGTGDNALFHKFALGNYNGFPDVTLTLTGLTPGDSYDLYTYVGAGNSGRVLDGTVGTTSYYLTAASLSAYTPGTATSAGSAVSGNYFEFQGLTVASSTTPVSFVLSTPASNGNYTALYGFQLVDVGSAGGGGGGSVPEPSTVWLFAFGILGLGLHRYRSRWAKI